jgi:hypothetical protein
MCSTIEREDVISIYLHRGRDLGLLSKAEQEVVIGQADGHLKRAKGKAMLPMLTENDIRMVLEDIPRNADGLISFHEIQKEIAAYRKARTKEYKLVFPSIAGGKKKNVDGGSAISGDDKLGSTGKSSQTLTIRKTKKKHVRSGRVSSMVAPETMFQYDEGKTNVEVVDATNKFLSVYASKLNELEAQSDVNVVANVRLLRTVEPKFKDPYMDKKTGKLTRPSFDLSKLNQGGSIGSGVKCANSTSTWKKKVTTY